MREFACGNCRLGERTVVKALGRCDVVRIKILVFSVLGCAPVLGNERPESSAIRGKVDDLGRREENVRKTERVLRSHGVGS